jgi:hypothetical protein
MQQAVRIVHRLVREHDASIAAYLLVPALKFAMGLEAEHRIHRAEAVADTFANLARTLRAEAEAEASEVH